MQLANANTPVIIDGHNHVDHDDDEYKRVLSCLILLLDDGS
jgi:hypothetical protein